MYSTPPLNGTWWPPRRKLSMISAATSHKVYHLHCIYQTGTFHIVYISIGALFNSNNAAPLRSELGQV